MCKWIRVKGFEDTYCISNTGKLASNKSGKWKVLKQTNKNGDYFSVVLTSKDKQTKTIRIHRLVAEHFIENPNNYKYVNHIDGNKQNNNVENLEWCTASQNVIHSMKMHKNQCDGMIYYNKFVRPKKIYQFSKNKNLIGEYTSATEASRKTGVCSRNILQVANKTPFNKKGNYRKAAGGFIWSFTKEVI